jgi:hypothetical protein
MKIRNQELWDKIVEVNKDDDYSNAVVLYARDWADLMESRIAKGETIEEMAKETSREADIDGITGNMYGMAVKILADTWEHGIELATWHNLQYARNDEEREIAIENAKKGMTVNPAVITLGVPKGTSDEQLAGIIGEAVEEAGGRVMSSQEFKEFMKKTDD